MDVSNSCIQSQLRVDYEFIVNNVTNGTHGITYTEDSMGNFNGELSPNFTTTEDRAGNQNSSFLFQNGYVLTDHNSISNIEEYTVCMWINEDIGQTELGTLLSVISGSRQTAIGIFTSGQVELEGKAKYPDEFKIFREKYSRQWSHLCLAVKAYNGNKNIDFQFYINANKVLDTGITSSQGFGLGNKVLILGQEIDAYTLTTPGPLVDLDRYSDLKMSILQAYYGRMDNFQIYESYIQQDHIIDIYQSGHLDIGLESKEFSFYMSEFKFYNFYPIEEEGNYQYEVVQFERYKENFKDYFQFPEGEFPETFSLQQSPLVLKGQVYPNMSGLTFRFKVKATLITDDSVVYYHVFIIQFPVFLQSKSQFLFEEQLANDASHFFTPYICELENGDILMAWLQKEGSGTFLIGKIGDKNGKIVKDTWDIDNNANRAYDGTVNVIPESGGGFTVYFVACNGDCGSYYIYRNMYKATYDSDYNLVGSITKDFDPGNYQILIKDVLPVSATQRIFLVDTKNFWFIQQAAYYQGDPSSPSYELKIINDETKNSEDQQRQQIHLRGLVLPDNSFLVTFSRIGRYYDGDQWGVQGQKFTFGLDSNNAFTPQGTEFQVNTVFKYNQFKAFPVLINDRGDFLIIYVSEGLGDNQDESHILGQAFSVDCSKIGEEFQISQFGIKNDDPSAFKIQNNQVHIVYSTKETVHSKTQISNQLIQFEIDGSNDLQRKQASQQIYVKPDPDIEQEEPKIYRFSDTQSIITWHTESKIMTSVWMNRVQILKDFPKFLQIKTNQEFRYQIGIQNLYLADRYQYKLKKYDENYKELSEFDWIDIQNNEIIVGEDTNILDAHFSQDECQESQGGVCVQKYILNLFTFSTQSQEDMGIEIDIILLITYFPPEIEIHPGQTRFMQVNNTQNYYLSSKIMDSYQIIQDNSEQKTILPKWVSFNPNDEKYIFYPVKELVGESSLIELSVQGDGIQLIIQILVKITNKNPQILQPLSQFSQRIVIGIQSIIQLPFSHFKDEDKGDIISFSTKIVKLNPDGTQTPEQGSQLTWEDIFYFIQFNANTLTYLINPDQLDNEGKYQIELFIQDQNDGMSSDIFEIEIYIDQPQININSEQLQLQKQVEDQISLGLVKFHPYTQFDLKLNRQFISSDVVSINATIEKNGDSNSNRRILTVQELNQNNDYWLKFDQNNFRFYGKPSEDEIGNYQVFMKCSNGFKFVETNFTFNVSNIAPILDTKLQDQLQKYPRIDIDFTFQFSESTFVDQDLDKLTYKIELVGGNPLPEFLNFNPESRTLTGVFPDIRIQKDRQSAIFRYKEPLEIQITAIDPSGFSVSDVLSLSVYPSTWYIISLIIQISSPLLVVISWIKYKDLVYAILCKKKYRVEQKHVLHPGEEVHFQIPVIKKDLVKSVNIFELLKKQAQGNDDPKWFSRLYRDQTNENKIRTGKLLGECLKFCHSLKYYDILEFYQQSDVEQFIVNPENPQTTLIYILNYIDYIEQFQKNKIAIKIFNLIKQAAQIQSVKQYKQEWYREFMEFEVKEQDDIKYNKFPIVQFNEEKFKDYFEIYSNNLTTQQQNLNQVSPEVNSVCNNNNMQSQQQIPDESIQGSAQMLKTQRSPESQKKSNIDQQQERVNSIHNISQVIQSNQGSTQNQSGQQQFNSQQQVIEIQDGNLSQNNNDTLYNLIKQNVIAYGLGIKLSGSQHSGQSLQISESKMGEIEVKRKIETNSFSIDKCIDRFSFFKLNYQDIELKNNNRLPDWIDYRVVHGTVLIDVKHEGLNSGKFKVQIKDRYKYLYKEYDIKLIYPEVKDSSELIQKFNQKFQEKEVLLGTNNQQNGGMNNSQSQQQIQLCDEARQDTSQVDTQQNQQEFEISQQSMETRREQQVMIVKDQDKQVDSISMLQKQQQILQQQLQQQENQIISADNKVKDSNDNGNGNDFESNQNQNSVSDGSNHSQNQNNDDNDNNNRNNQNFENKENSVSRKSSRSQQRDNNNQVNCNSKNVIENDNKDADDDNNNDIIQQNSDRNSSDFGSMQKISLNNTNFIQDNFTDNNQTQQINSQTPIKSQQTILIQSLQNDNSDDDNNQVFK